MHFQKIFKFFQIIFEILREREAVRLGLAWVGAVRVRMVRLPVSVGARGVGPDGWGTEGWRAQNFARFFPLPSPFSFFFSLWGSSRGIFVGV